MVCWKRKAAPASPPTAAKKRTAKIMGPKEGPDFGGRVAGIGAGLLSCGAGGIAGVF